MQGKCTAQEMHLSLMHLELAPVIAAPSSVPRTQAHQAQHCEDTKSFSRYQDTSPRHHHTGYHQNTTGRRKSPSTSRGPSRPNSPQRPAPVLIQAQTQDSPEPLYPSQRSEIS